MKHAWYKSRLVKYTSLLATTAAALYTTLAMGDSPLGATPELMTPLGVVQAGKPMVMLTMARDHTLFYEAYNDASDIDGDGLLDIRFKPTITYLGLFDSALCYKYSGASTATSTDGLFSPAYAADALGRCSSDTNGGWSGNWLNYVTTSRVDALRKVLYGGHREVDTASQTILRRAYIPQDAHSWAKEYQSTAVDGYDITQYTPFTQPSGAGVRRHFFGSLTDTAGINCLNIDTCSNRPPILKFLENSRDRRVWQWASSERPVLTKDHNGTQSSSQQYSVRVEVCTAAFNNGCKQYPNGSYKPTGLLHDYGENDSMYFGLLTGSYNKSTEGGVLRKVVSSFRDEVDETTGQFTENARIVKSIDSLRIRDFNNATTSNSYRAGWVTNRAMNAGEFPDWGNPIGEMMYESLRYFAGKAASTATYIGNNARDSGKDIDAEIGLTAATWDDPYSDTSAAKAEWCAKPNMLVVSGINPSFDSDQVPGAHFPARVNNKDVVFSGDIPSLNVSTLGQTIADFEPGIKGNRFIGQVGTSFDGAPTAKNVTTLGNIRGLAPEEPTKQGSYYASSIAYFGKTNDIRSDVQGKQTVDTFTVALSSPLPKIEVPINGKLVTLVPFAKSVTSWKPSFAPTNQIVDFYIESFANTTGPSGVDYDPSINDGRYFARFRINFEDVEQGADHDMDAVTTYEVALTEDNTLRIKLIPEYQAGGAKQNMGYIISGTTRDGVYLVVQDENHDPPKTPYAYYLNVPDGMYPGACDAAREADIPAACYKLPYITNPIGQQFSERIFEVGNTSATYLKDPLWYASKWGGFVDRNNNNRPDLTAEWDLDRDGVPDTYFLVQNPTKLREALRKVFNSIYERSAAAGNIAANSTSFTSETAVYQSVFNSGNWSGDLIAYPITRNGINFSPFWKASEKLPAHTARRIFTRADDEGVALTSALDDDIKSLIDPVSATQDITINYLRGERSNEVQNGGNLRNRPSSILGDIVNSSPYYLKENNTVFVGSNSGMLHAFNARTGVERFAYVPSTMLPNLKSLTQTGYQHRFYVDGEIAVSALDETDNKNILFGFLGRGGKGMFALDVTNPDTFQANHVLWEVGGSDDDMGYVLGRPQIAKVKTGSDTQATVLVFGNGYNSTSGKAALFIYNTDGSLLKKLSTEVGTVNNPNGMASPYLLKNNNGFLTTVYAGDLQGNVWKFDVSDEDTSKWGSAMNNGSTAVPLYTVMDPDGKVQPITAPITSYINEVYGDPHFGKRFVFFGTGKYMAPEDPSVIDTQTMYGLIDDGSPIIGRSQLVKRTITAEGLFAGRTVRTFSQTVLNDMEGKKGWYMDWRHPTNTPEGERVVSAAQLIYGFKPVLVVSSIIPVVDPCVPGGRGYVNALNPFSGGSVFSNTDDKGFFDVNNNNSFGDDKLGDKRIDSLDMEVGLPGECVLVGNRLVCGGSKATIESVKVFAGESNRRRVSWREIVR
jgi:type IV pilus assembly protein PilY1